MWNWIKRNIFRIEQSVEHDRPSLPTTDAYHAENIDLIIAIAGHEENGGTTIYTDESENSFCSDVVVKIDQLMPEKDVVVSARRYKSYRAYLKDIKKKIKRIAKEMNVPLSRILVMEFHLNDASRKAHGGELLCRDTKSIGVLRPFISEFCAEFNITPRRDGGIYHIESGNGVGFLNVVRGLGCYGGIFEPCFVGYKSKENSQFFDNRTMGIDKISKFSAKKFKEILEA